LVAWKFAAGRYQDIIVAEGSIQVFTQGNVGSLKLSDWIKAAKGATQVIISINSELDYLKIKYRLVNYG
jgi:hypothetical protein